MKTRIRFAVPFVTLWALASCSGEPGAPTPAPAPEPAPLAALPAYDANAGALENRTPASDPAPRRLLRDMTPFDSPPLPLADGAALDAPVLARGYNLLRIRVRTDAAESMRLVWTSDLEPDADAHPGLVWPLIADGAAHTYTLPLDGETAPTWAGEITAVAWRVDGAATVESAELLYEAPNHAPTLTIGTRTHPAIAGNPPLWRVHVPESARFQTAVAVPGHAYRERPHSGARFVVAVTPEGGESTVVADTTLTPAADPAHGNWQSLAADLAPFAGQSVAIALTAYPLGERAGHYAYWGAPEIVAPQASHATPVFLISTDTLRYDHLPMYGYDRDTAPNLAAFANEAVVFDNAYTQDAWTLPSHMSMVTGLHPKHHGADAHSRGREHVRPISETLARSGYLTGAWTGISAWFDAPRGYPRGFDHYEHPVALGLIGTTRPKAEAWLEAHRANPVFVFFHNYDVHSKSHLDNYSLPYDPGTAGYTAFSDALGPAPRFERPGQAKLRATEFLAAHNRGELVVTPEERDYMRALYDDCIAYVDDNLGAFFAKLKELGLYDDALIIITSDHGEAFGEHGMYLHGEAYETQTRIPMIIRFPKGEHGGRRIGDLVQLPDLAPTILDVCGLEHDAPMDGLSLLPLLNGETQNRPFAYSQRIANYAVRSGDWKLYDNRADDTRELYNLADDPRETRNRFGEGVPEQGALEAEWRRFYDFAGPGWHIAFHAGPGESAIEFALTATAPMTYARLLESEQILWPKRNDDLLIETPLRLKGKGLFRGAGNDRDLLHLDVPGAESEVVVQLESDAPFRLVAGGAEAREGAAFTLTLDRAMTAKPAAFDAEPPAVYVWYEAEEALP